jgi:hypothetical protein
MDELFGYGKAVTLIVLMAATLGALAVATMLPFVPLAASDDLMVGFQSVSM